MLPSARRVLSAMSAYTGERVAVASAGTDSAQQKVSPAMPIFRKGRTSVLFIHVPKTGGSSLENLFLSSGWEVELLDRGMKRTFNPHRLCSPQHMHASMLANTLRLDTFDLTFMLVREPIALFRSELVMRNPSLTTAWSREVEKCAQRLLRTSTTDPHVADNHVRPQHEFYVPGTKVFQLESGLENVATTLRDEHGLRLDLTKGVPSSPS